MLHMSVLDLVHCHSVGGEADFDLVPSQSVGGAMPCGRSCGGMLVITGVCSRLPEKEMFVFL